MDVDIDVAAISADQITQLLNGLYRIRSERDAHRLENEELRRHLSFVKVENKCTEDDLRNQIRTLRTQLSNASARATTSPSHAPSSSQMLHLQRATLATAVVAQRSEAQCELYAGRLETISRDLESANIRCQKAELLAQERDATLRQLRSEDVEMRDSLAVTEYKVSTLESRNTDLTALVSRYKEELESINESKVEMSDTFARSQAQLSETVKQLEAVQSQRSSLALQITHLEQDLESAKRDVAEAETRYSELQSKQLATMSTNEQLRALRHQIEEQGQRVLRRNEQIGIHQHDIKRLETNLKLQEERVMEMTGELETLEAEKLAMIEDCRTTREERDEARRRCADLEESLEVLEENLLAAERQRENEVTSVVRAVVDACSKRRQLSTRFAEATASREARTIELTRQLEEARQAASSAQFNVEQSHTSSQTIREDLQCARAELHHSHRLLSEESHRTTCATVALSVVLGDLRQVGSISRSRKANADSLQGDLAEVKQRFESHLQEFTALQARHETLLSAKHAQDDDVSAVQARYVALQRDFATLQQEHSQTVAQLSHSKEELDSQLSNTSERLQKEEALRLELDAAQNRFEQDASELRTRLSTALTELENVKLEKANLESAHRQAVDDLNASKDQLQQNLADALRTIEEAKGTKDELKLAEGQRLAEVIDLREDLDTARRALDEVTRARDELVARHDSVAAELEERKREVVDISRAKEDLEAELQTLRSQYDADAKSLQRQLEDATSSKAENEGALSRLQAWSDEVAQQKRDLEDKLETVTTAMEELQLELKAEAQRHSQESEEHQSQLNAARDRQQAAETSLSQLEEEFSAIKQRVQESEEALEAAKREKDEIEAHNTTLQADIQRSRSLQRLQEETIEKREREISHLKEKLDALRADYSRSEQNANAAEMQLTLQSVKHKEVVDSFNSQLARLQATSELQETVLELQEKNEDLEKLLQDKNGEIEENDDRFIQNSKEKKKLTAKVEALTRKVKTLQEKVEKLEANSQDSTPKALPSLATATSGPPLLTPAASSDRPQTRTALDTSAATSRSRAATGPAATSRSKTPEAIRSIFRSRTPETKHAPLQSLSPAQPMPTFVAQPSDMLMDLLASSSSSSSIGKKRRAPDDFDEHESLPVQSFSAESAPVGRLEGAKTPRGSRKLGFTPMRGGSTSQQRSTSPPRRAPTAPAIIADVTNSPRSKSNPLKKGWLKMKPGPTQGSNGRTATSSRPPITDRAQNPRGS